MSSRNLRAVAACVTIAAAAVALAPAAHAVPGPGTFTAITTPSGDVHFTSSATDPNLNKITVSGVTSPDVTSVDIDCVYSQNGSAAGATLVPGVVVTSGTFTTTVTLNNAFRPTCRLRAVPTGADVNGYLGSYAGPILFSNMFQPSPPQPQTPYGYDASNDFGDGVALFKDASSCGVVVLLQLPVPGLEASQTPAQCTFALTHHNVPTTGAATGSAVTVDGHNAYLPAGVHDYLNGGRNLGLAPTTDSTTVTLAPDGSATVTETAPLVRCSVNDTYPPTNASCPHLVDTGVSFRRVTRLVRNGQQVQVQDAFRSEDGAAHTVAPEYSGQLGTLGSGTPGVALPSRGYTPLQPGQVVTGLAPGAGAMYYRADIHAAPDQAGIDTVAYTWSRPPTALVFDGASASRFGLRYTLALAPQSTESLALALSSAATEAAASALSQAAQDDTMSAPVITSPAPSARIGTATTVVTGTLVNGLNGLPTSATVNGRAATISVRDAAHATYSARLVLPWGRHPITVTARDAGGNTRTASVVVTNTPALVPASRPRLRAATLQVPVVCQRFAAGACTGKIVVRSARGAVVGRTGAFRVVRGRSTAVPVRLRPGLHAVRVYVYQREPNGSYVLASSKSYRV